MARVIRLRKKQEVMGIKLSVNYMEVIEVVKLYRGDGN